MSSYKSAYDRNNISWKELFQTLIFMVNPKKIVEFGILDGFTLDIFLSNTDEKCSIDAYDLFEKGLGKHSDYKYIKDKYSDYKNCKIKKLDFYGGHNFYEDGSIDILHIDICPDKNTYVYAIDNYFSKLSKNGIMILDGGSKERDEVWWMLKFDKNPILPFLKNLKNKHDFLVIDAFPSTTIIKNN